MNVETVWIEKYFHCPPSSPAVLVGIGDDGAVLQSKAPLAVATDTIAIGAHFPADAAARTVGHKALAVNLSDMAAMGAAPRWAVLALSVPKRDEAWIADFADGFLSLARAHRLDLVGGDLVRAPLSVTVTVIGEFADTSPIKRSGARRGDGLYITGNIGDAGLAWQKPVMSDRLSSSLLADCRQRMLQPTPRVREGLFMAAYASAAIDVSDGLLLDLQRVLQASGVGAEVRLERIPLGPACAELYKEKPLAALGMGEDYELLLAVPPEKESALQAHWPADAAPLSRIGTIISDGLVCLFHERPVTLPKDPPGFDHFASS